MNISKLTDNTFLRFVIVGVINTIFGAGIMFVFYNGLHLSYWISSASNYFFGSILSYILNKRFTFRSEAPLKQTGIRFVINIVVCYAIAYGLAKPLAIHALSGMSTAWQENIAMCIGMCLFVVLNYFGQRLIVFKKQKKDY